MNAPFFWAKTFIVEQALEQLSNVAQWCLLGIYCCNLCVDPKIWQCFVSRGVDLYTVK